MPLKPMYFLVLLGMVSLVGFIERQTLGGGEVVIPSVVFLYCDVVGYNEYKYLRYNPLS